MTFEVEQSKYTDGKIKLIFDEALTNIADELTGLVKVKNQNGEVKNIKVEYGEKQQFVVINVLNGINGEMFQNPERVRELYTKSYLVIWYVTILV